DLLGVQVAAPGPVPELFVDDREEGGLVAVEQTLPGVLLAAEATLHHMALGAGGPLRLSDLHDRVVSQAPRRRLVASVGSSAWRRWGRGVVQAVTAPVAWTGGPVGRRRSRPG